MRKILVIAFVLVAAMCGYLLYMQKKGKAPAAPKPPAEAAAAPDALDTDVETTEAEPVASAGEPAADPDAADETDPAEETEPPEPPADDPEPAGTVKEPDETGEGIGASLLSFFGDGGEASDDEPADDGTDEDPGATARLLSYFHGDETDEADEGAEPAEIDPDAGYGPPGSVPPADEEATGIRPVKFLSKASFGMTPAEISEEYKITKYGEDKGKLRLTSQLDPDNKRRLLFSFDAEEKLVRMAFIMKPGKKDDVFWLHRRLKLEAHRRYADYTKAPTRWSDGEVIMTVTKGDGEVRVAYEKVKEKKKLPGD